MDASQLLFRHRLLFPGSRARCGSSIRALAQRCDRSQSLRQTAIAAKLTHRAIDLRVRRSGQNILLRYGSDGPRIAARQPAVLRLWIYCRPSSSRSRRSSCRCRHCRLSIAGRPDHRRSVWIRPMMARALLSPVVQHSTLQRRRSRRLPLSSTGKPRWRPRGLDRDVGGRGRVGCPHLLRS